MFRYKIIFSVDGVLNNIAFVWANSPIHAELVFYDTYEFDPDAQVVIDDVVLIAV